MKVIYEFDANVEHDDYHDLKIFQKANNMHSTLIEIQQYLRQIRKEFIEDDKEKIIDEIHNMIFDSGIGELE